MPVVVVLVVVLVVQGRMQILEGSRHRIAWHGRHDARVVAINSRRNTWVVAHFVRNVHLARIVALRLIRETRVVAGCGVVRCGVVHLARVVAVRFLGQAGVVAR